MSESWERIPEYLDTDREGIVLLNLGCGKNIRPGWINVDRFDSPGVDVVHDLEVLPLPFDDDSIDHVTCSHVLEHLLRWEHTVLDVHRILKPGGTFEILVPFGLRPSVFHIRTFKTHSIDGFTHDNYRSLEATTYFELIKREMHRTIPFRWHINKHLHLNIPEQTPIGVRNEIVWHLRKVEAIQ